MESEMRRRFKKAAPILQIIMPSIAAILFVLVMQNMADLMDGQRIGFGKWSPSIVLGWVVTSLLVTVAFVHAPGKIRKIFSIGAAIIVFVLISRGHAPQYLLAQSWDSDCKGGNGRACYALGNRYNVGIDVAKDSNRAIAMYQDGCSKKAGIACDALLTKGGEQYRPFICSQFPKAKIWCDRSP